MNDVRITVYGGVAGEGDAGEIGGNRILVEWDDRRWFCDFGLRFARMGRYYEEFLKPRTGTVGLRDHLRMGLLPPLEGLYRDDLWVHEPDLWDRYRDHPLHRRIDHVDGVLVSHAHLDHNGNLGFLREDIPVYTGVVSAAIAKAMQDTRSGGPDTEFCYLAPREAKDGVLQGTRGAPRKQRRHIVCEDTELAEPLVEFWCAPPGPRTPLDHCPLELWNKQEGLRFWRVDHSIPGSGAFSIQTPQGWVIYSGDLRRHGHSAGRVEKFVREAAELDPVLLIIEGTRVGSQETVTEATIRDAADDVIARSQGLVVADFGPRNVERLRTFHEVAVGRDRQLVITAADAYLLEQLHVIDENIPTPSWESVLMLREPMGTEGFWKRSVFDRHAVSVVDAATIRSDPDAFICCWSFWDIKNLIDVEPDGGTYIYSSAEAFNEEMVIDQLRLANWLEHFGLNPVGGLPGAERGPYHSSGHADGPAVESIVETIAPERILPVHTTNLEWFTRRWGDKVLVAPEGEPVWL